MLAAASVCALSMAAPVEARQYAAPGFERSLRGGERAQMLEALEAAPSHGLPDYGVSPHMSDAELERAVIAYAAAMRGQRMAGRFIADWTLQPARYNAASAYRSALQGRRVGAWLDSLAPRNQSYETLRGALVHYREIQARGGWGKLGPTVLKIGSRGPAVAALRARLAVEAGGGRIGGEEMVFDEWLADTLRQEQQRLGAPVTGALDKATIAALNVPVEARIATLEANLERERWLPSVLPSYRIEVNVAAQQLEALRGDRVLLAMRTIVGRPSDPTPMLSDVVEGAVFNPPWNVPTKIAKNQIWPKAQKDKAFLVRNDYLVLPGGMLQQRPGPKSALGKIKFEMTNPMAIYLHDTPSKDLFGKDLRAFSNGCVRIERPRDLADLLFGHERDWRPEAIEAAIDSGETTRASMREPVPVFTLYRTAFVGSDGQVNFRSDVYKWDAKLHALLG